MEFFAEFMGYSAIITVFKRLTVGLVLASTRIERGIGS